MAMAGTGSRWYISPIREILFPPHTETISPLGKIVPCLITSLFDIKQLINDDTRAGAERAPGRFLLSSPRLV